MTTEPPRRTMTDRGRITWPCEVCGKPIKDGAGYLTVSIRAMRVHEDSWVQYRERLRQRREAAGNPALFAEDLADMPRTQRAHWLAVHGECDPDPGSGGHQIEVERIRTAHHLLAWTAHLMGKRWLRDTDWADLLGGIGGNLP